MRVAPELAEWADFFAAGAGRRAAAEAGLNVVGRREADDLIRQVDQFIGTVEGTLGLPSQPVLAGTGPAGTGPAAAGPAALAALAGVVTVGRRISRSRDFQWSPRLILSPLLRAA